MSYAVNPRHYANVLALPYDQRLEYCIKHIADWQELWLLAKGGKAATLADDLEQECLPVWPHEAFAAAHKLVEDGYKPSRQKLKRFLSEQGMAGSRIAVFPIDFKATVVPISTFADMLESEMAKALFRVE